MDFEEHLEMARDPNNIPGIYNYCDSWCERCLFTSRCLNYKTRARFEKEREREQREEENKVFWDQVNQAIEDVKDVLEEKQETETNTEITGFDDEDNGDIGEGLDEFEKHRQKAREQPVSKAAKRYMNTAMQFFKEKEGVLGRFFTEGDGVIKNTEAGITDEITLQRISIAVQVAFYYHFQIWVKVNRALTSSYDDFENDEENADLLKDSDGSAKVALLGIDQSIVAWKTLYKYLLEDKGTIAGIISLLKQLQNGIERVFPNARNFTRPGFDDYTNLTPK